MEELKLYDVEMQFPDGVITSAQVYDVDFNSVADRLMDRYPSVLVLVCGNE